MPRHDQIWSSPALGADGTIYVGSLDGNLYALNPEGSLKWKYPTGSYIDSSPTVGADGTIYVGSWDNNLYALTDNGTSCSLKWKYATGAAIASSPAIGADGTIYVGSNDYNLYALTDNGTSAKSKWSYTTGSYISSSPAVDANGMIYVGSWDDNLYCIYPEDGWIDFVHQTGNAINSSPTIGADGAIYIASLDHFIYALNMNGYMSWGYYTGAMVESSSALDADGTIYIGCDDHNLYALSSEGELKWTFTTEGNVRSSPAIGADGTLYVGSDDGNLYALTNPPPPAFTLTKSASSSQSLPGHTVTYTLSCTNVYNAVTTKVTLTDILPEYLGYVPESATGGGEYNAATGTLTWNLGTLNAGASVQVTFQAAVEESTPLGTDIVNVAHVYCAEAPAPMQSNQATVIVSTGDDWQMFHHDVLHTGRSHFTPSAPLLKWTVLTGSMVASSPAIGMDGTIYVGSDDYNLYAFNPADGSLKWKFATGSTSIPLRPSARTERSTSAQRMEPLCGQPGGRFAEVEICHGICGRILSGPRRGRDDLRRLR